MVKNTTGGSKTKGQARKHLTAAYNTKLRLSECTDEVYAKVTSIFGNGMLEVLCIDNKKRLCHIRGKFKGRGKRDNFITRNSWLLVGKRTWESDELKEVKGKIKLPNCDLLEVYRDSDINRIKNTIDNDWSIFVDEIKDSKIGGEIVFTDEDTYNLIEVDSTASTETKTNVISLLNEKDSGEINIDEI
jgi:translation initiation factor 1A